tara:strand:+ start:162 stop:335 length:174 start_codon:yes stop_codon:yes gene_type:complete
MTKYAIPRKVELPKEEAGEYFNDKRTRRRKADKYTGKVYDPAMGEFAKELLKYQKKI